MYGMINKFISSTVIDRYGRAKWEQIANQLDLNSEIFIEMQAYGDDVTFGIVGKAVEVLDVDAETFLQELGYDWVGETAKGAYQEMYSLVDGGMFEFIANLNNMHNVISSQMPDLVAPSFLSQRTESGDILIKYFSQREGLEPFVKGLLQGLCKHFEEDGVVEILSAKTAEQPFAEFSISF